MEVVETNIRSSLHNRSSSLKDFEQHLNRLKDFEATPSLLSSSICHRLDDSQDLQGRIDKLLQLTITQQALAQEYSNKQVDEVLDGSLRLLDICRIFKDCLLQSQDSMRQLQSVIRRRRDVETGFTTEGEKYLACRKKKKNVIGRALKAIKNEFTVSSSNKHKETFSMVSVLKEVQVVTMSSLESLLLFIAGPKGQLKQSKWSIISKLVQPKRISCDSALMNSKWLTHCCSFISVQSLHLLRIFRATFKI